LCARRPSAEYALQVTLGVFDTVPDEDGRQAHLDGEVAGGLTANADPLASEPQTEEVDVLAAKHPAEAFRLAAVRSSRTQTFTCRRPTCRR